jgi:hypothetical protein
MTYVNTEDMKTENTKSTDIKAEDVKTEDVKTENVKTENIKTEGIKTENIKTEDTEYDGADQQYRKRIIIIQKKIIDAFTSEGLSMVMSFHARAEALVVDALSAFAGNVPDQSSRPPSAHSSSVTQDVTKKACKRPATTDHLQEANPAKRAATLPGAVRQSVRPSTAESYIKVESDEY